MEVNEDAGPQSWEHFENQVVDVATQLDRVGRIDEEQIARTELAKVLEADLSSWGALEPVESSGVFAKDGCGLACRTIA